MLLRIQSFSVLLLLVASGSPLTAISLTPPTPNTASPQQTIGSNPAESPAPARWTQVMETSLREPRERSVATEWFAGIGLLLVAATGAGWMVRTLRRRNRVQLRGRESLWVPPRRRRR